MERTEMEQQGMPPELARIAQGRDHLDTAEYGRAIKRTGQTIRKNLCIAGHAYGIRPLKVGGRLLWPVAEVAKLLHGGQ
jgi:hypothetical protein